MNIAAKTLFAVTLAVTGAASLALPVQAADGAKATDFYNSEQTAASSRMNAEWRANAQPRSEVRSLVQGDVQASGFNATQPQRGYGF